MNTRNSTKRRLRRLLVEFLVFKLLTLAWLELAKLVLDLLGFLLASLDVVLLRFACFICLVFMVWLPVLLWFALFACLV